MKLSSYRLRRLFSWLFVGLMLCVMSVTCAPPSRAGEYDWAVPSGPVPGVPEPNGPVCANCNGAGCSICQPDTGGEDTTNSTSDPTPTPNPTPGQSNTTTPVTPTPTVDPQQQFERQKEILLKEFQMPAGLGVDDAPDLSSALPVVRLDDSFSGGPVPAGLSDSEWKEAADCQKALDALYTKWPLSATEIAEADKLEARRNALWEKAISVPGLTAEERDRMRLKLHTLSLPSGMAVPTVGKETLDKWLKPPPLPAQGQDKPAVPTVNPVSSWLVGQFATGQLQSGIEAGGEAWADAILEEHSFGDFLGVSKIALAYKEGGLSSAASETLSYLVGKIPIPQASMAVEGGRQYANVVFQVQNKFMTDAMKATGGEFDKEKFWSEFNDDCNWGQKAVKEWIGYGAE